MLFFKFLCFHLFHSHIATVWELRLNWSLKVKLDVKDPCMATLKMGVILIFYTWVNLVWIHMPCYFNGWTMKI